jgi:two-component system sensor kinase FixL
LRIDVADGLPDIYGDRVHLQQVILNLLLNSLDAMNGKTEEQRQIVIRASQTTDGMVEFAVVDSGTGVAAEQLPHLFEPFYTTKKNGMGIGLAISKTIVEMHGGEIMATNNPDGGTTVRFTVKVSLTKKEQL